MDVQTVLFLTIIVGGALWIWRIIATESKGSSAQNQVTHTSSDTLLGLYYQLQNGTELFIAKSNQKKQIEAGLSDLKRKSARVSSIINYETFERVCGERFDPDSLYIKPIDNQTILYPMYRLTGILWQ